MSDVLTLDGLLARPAVEKTLTNGAKVRIHKVSSGERELAHKAAREAAVELAATGKKDESGELVDWDGNVFAAHMVAYGLAEPKVPIERVDDLLMAKSVEDLGELYDLVQDVTAGGGGTVDERVSDFPAADAEGVDGDVPSEPREGVEDAPAPVGHDPG